MVNEIKHENCKLLIWLLSAGFLHSNQVSVLDNWIYLHKFSTAFLVLFNKFFLCKQLRKVVANLLLILRLKFSSLVWYFRLNNKYGTVQVLRSTFSHIKSINIDFSLVWFVSLYVYLWVRMWAWCDKQKNKQKNIMTCRVAAQFPENVSIIPSFFSESIE